MRRGAHESFEARVRRVVADSLGVEAHDLGPSVSLADDLAADSLDLVELALDLETELGIAVPERLLERVRTFGDLIEAAGRLADGAAGAPALPHAPGLPLAADLPAV
jgi:acyl carrier protein